MNERTAVYRLYDAADVLLYVGVGSYPRWRIREHASRSWFPQVAWIDLAWYPTRKSAERAESGAIAAEGPLYNIAGTPLHRRVSGFKADLTAAEIERWAAADTAGSRRAQNFDRRFPRLAGHG